MRQKGNKHKFCNTCNKLLIVGGNTSQALINRSMYKCTDCVKKARNKKEKRKTTYSNLNRADDAVKFCRVCETVLIEGVNIKSSSIKYHNYRCNVCEKEARAGYSFKKTMEKMNARSEPLVDKPEWTKFHGKEMVKVEK